MRWLWFLGSLGCFAVLFRTTSIALALLCLIGALAFLLIGTLAVAAQRIERNRGDGGRLFSPEEIRQMRDADAQRKSEHDNATHEHSEPDIVGTATMAALIASEAAERSGELASTSRARPAEIDNAPEDSEDAMTNPDKGSHPA